jgi:uncharacterized protein
VPERNAVTPGVVLVGGSGPADRSNHGYFDALRDHLLDAGMAVLTFDKRGVGGSGGEWAPADAGDLARDVIDAADTLRAHPLVDRSAVSLFGHSEGGWVALRAAVTGARPSQLILNSCPAVSFFESEVYALTAAGVDSALARNLFERLREAVRADTDLATAARMFDTEPDPALRQLLEQSGFRLTDQSYAQLRAWIDYSPDADLSQLRVRTLALYGTSDAVTPVQQSIEQLASLSPSVQTELFAGADHRLQIGGALVPGYLDAVASWLGSDGSRAS